MYDENVKMHEITLKHLLHFSDAKFPCKPFHFYDESSKYLVVTMMAHAVLQDHL